MLASAGGIVAFDQVVLLGSPDKMAAAGLPDLVLVPAMAQIVGLGQATADTEVTPAGMLVAADQVSLVPMLVPERIAGPAVVVVPIATQFETEGQVTWEIDEVVAGTLSATRSRVLTVPE